MRKKFSSIVSLYGNSITTHQLVGPIPMTMIKGETKVKSWISWDNRSYTLNNLYEPFENHIFGVGFQVVVNSGEERLNKIVDNFWNCKIGSFVWVMMINRLHVSLPWLVIVIFIHVIASMQPRFRNVGK